MSTQTMKNMVLPVWKYSRIIQHLEHKKPYRISDFTQSFSLNQIEAKTWLVERLMLHDINSVQNKKIWILGSWYGTVLVPLLLKKIKGISEINMIDYDAETLDVARTWLFPITHYPQVKMHHMDINFDFEKIHGDLVINTSCEHMLPMHEFDIKGLCVFQSNDFTQEYSHINCVKSIDELVLQSGITDVHYTGERPFDDFHDCKRYMVIGKR